MKDDKSKLSDKTERSSKERSHYILQAMRGKAQQDAARPAARAQSSSVSSGAQKTPLKSEAQQAAEKASAPPPKRPAQSTLLARAAAKAFQQSGALETQGEASALPEASSKKPKSVELLVPLAADVIEKAKDTASPSDALEAVPASAKTDRQGASAPSRKSGKSRKNARSKTRAKAAASLAQPKASKGEAVARKVASSKPSDIARMKEPRSLSVDDLAMKKIIYPEHPDRQVLERFSRLKNQLLTASKGQNFTLTVTSTVNKGGASFVAVNLAAAFAFDSSRTALLIDCNLRYPTLHHAFDMVPDLGVTDFLDDPIMDVASVIYPTGIKRLRFIPVGKRHDATSEYLTSYRMKQLLENVRSRYPDRFIILDTPPISELPDAGLLSQLTDYSLVVSPHGKMRESRIVDACNRIPADKLLGVVFNN